MTNAGGGAMHRLSFTQLSSNVGIQLACCRQYARSVALFLS